MTCQAVNSPPVSRDGGSRSPTDSNAFERSARRLLIRAAKPVASNVVYGMAAPAQTKVGRRIEWLAVAGAVAQAFLYCAIGFTAIRAAIYAGDTPQNTAGALKEMAAGLIGRTTIGFLALAFMCIASARIVEAWRGRVRHLGDIRGVAVRVWSAAVAVVYGGLAMLSLRFFFQPSAPADENTSHWAALTIARPFGPWLLGGIGIVTAGFGVHQLITALPQGDFPRWMRYCGLYGRLSFALLLIVIGGSATTAAAFRSPGNARGVSGALTFLQHQLFGPVLLAGLGGGLLMYGVFSAIQAFRNPSNQVNAAV